MSKVNYDVIVIGAGFGGSPCAALLAKRGLKVLLLEKNARAGGKAMTLTKGGHTYTAWVVVAAPMIDNQFEKVLKELGMEEKVKLVAPGIQDTIYRTPSGEYKKLPHMEPGNMDPNVIFDWLDIAASDREEALKFLSDLTLMTPLDMDALNDTSFDEFVRRYNVPKPLYAMLVSMMCDLMFMIPVDSLSAAEAVKSLQDIFLRSGGLFCEGGFGALAEVYCEAVRVNGGKVVMKAKVEKILVDQGKVNGVVTDKGSFQAPIVISNAGIQPTVLKLVGEEHFDQGYVNYVKDLVPSIGMMGTRYFLNKKVIDVPYGVIFSDETPWSMERYQKAKEGEMPKQGVVFFEVPANYDPHAAPEGRQMVMTGYWCPADPQMTEKEKNAWRDMGEKVMLDAYPDLEKHIESKETYTPAHVCNLTRDQVLPGQGGECIGLGQLLGQCARTKPSVKAPVRGLFFVGCDAGGYGVGTQQAVDSAINVAEGVLRYHRMHKATP
jgi:phytoene dehydrogenase-like protein